MKEIVAKIRKLAKENRIIFSTHERNRSLDRAITQEEAKRTVLSGLIYEYTLGYERFTAVSKISGKFIRVGLELREDVLIFSTVMEIYPNSWEARLYKKWLGTRRG